MRRQVGAIPVLAREVVLAPSRLGEDDVKALASALHADATRIGDGWRLFRRDETVAELRRQDHAWIRAQAEASAARVDALGRGGKEPYDVALGIVRDALASTGSERATKLDQAGMHAHEAGPGSRLLAELARHLPSDALAGTVPGTTAIFSNAPQGVERPLRVDPTLLATYTAAQKRFAERANASLASDGVPEDYRWVFPERPLVAGNRTLILRVIRTGGEPIFALQVYDPLGRKESGGTLTTRGFGAPPPTVRKTRFGRVSLSSETVASFARRTPGDPAFRKEALDPASFEPLDAVVREALLRWGRAKGFERVVACVPDALDATVPKCLDGAVLDLDGVTQALDEADCESLPVGRTLVVRPAHPLQEEATRADRGAMAALYRAASGGRFGLDDLFAYHAAYPDLYDSNPLVRRFGSAIRDAYGLRRTEWSLPHPFLAILGLLPAERRARALGGDSVPLDLPAMASSLLALALYATPMRNGATELDGAPTRRFAQARGVALQAVSPGTRISLRRVARGYAEVERTDPFTGRLWVEKGDDLVLDADFIPPSFVAHGLPRGMVAKEYRFLWKTERTLELQIAYEGVAQSQTFRIYQTLDAAREPVPFDQIPGLAAPPSP